MDLPDILVCTGKILWTSPMNITIKTVSGFTGVTIAVLSVLLITGDGVAILFTYASLIFVLPLIGKGNKGILKIYVVVFVIAHLVLGWRMAAMGFTRQNPPTITN